MSRSSWTDRINRQMRQRSQDWLHDSAGNAERLTPLETFLDELAVDYQESLPPEEQQRVVDDEIGWLDKALNPDNIEKVARLQPARERWTMSVP